MVAVPGSTETTTTSASGAPNSSSTTPPNAEKTKGFAKGFFRNLPSLSSVFKFFGSLLSGLLSALSSKVSKSAATTPVASPRKEKAEGEKPADSKASTTPDEIPTSNTTRLEDPRRNRVRGAAGRKPPTRKKIDQ